tara:strand:+ start:2545 stop:3036 length:492 start_codon:yes stop_codon:yes gene_type:complete
MRILALIHLALMAVAGAQDPGKEVIGKVRTEVLFGTNGSPESLRDGVVPLREEEVAKLKKVAKLEPYKTFVRLGSVEQDILKGYKSWAQPINGSQALMLTFQPQASIKESRKLRLDVEYWQKSKMTLRWDRVFEVGKRVYLIGPRWRDGNLIVTVELINLKSK